MLFSQKSENDTFVLSQFRDIVYHTVLLTVHIQSFVNIFCFHLYSQSFCFYIFHILGLCTWWRTNTFPTTEFCLPAAFCADPKRPLTRLTFDPKRPLTRLPFDP